VSVDHAAGVTGRNLEISTLVQVEPTLFTHSTKQVAPRLVFRALPGAMLFLISLVGCGAMTVAPCRDDGQPAVQELLYFGTETPSGHVTTEDWTQFLNEIVTPRSPMDSRPGRPPDSGGRFQVKLSANLRMS